MSGGVQNLSAVGLKACWDRSPQVRSFSGLYRPELCSHPLCPSCLFLVLTTSVLSVWRGSCCGCFGSPVSIPFPSGNCGLVRSLPSEAKVWAHDSRCQLKLPACEMGSRSQAAPAGDGVPTSSPSLLRILLPSCWFRELPISFQWVILLKLGWLGLLIAKTSLPGELPAQYPSPSSRLSLHTSKEPEESPVVSRRSAACHPGTSGITAQHKPWKRLAAPFFPGWHCAKLEKAGVGTEGRRRTTTAYPLAHAVLHAEWIISKHQRPRNDPWNNLFKVSRLLRSRAVLLLHHTAPGNDPCALQDRLGMANEVLKHSKCLHSQIHTKHTEHQNLSCYLCSLLLSAPSCSY